MRTHSIMFRAGSSQADRHVYPLPRVIANIGVARAFAAVTAPVPDLLCLAEIEEAGGLGDWLLHDIGPHRLAHDLPLCPAAWRPPAGWERNSSPVAVHRWTSLPDGHVPAR
jgi:hypothetical protein